MPRRRMAAVLVVTACSLAAVAWRQTPSSTERRALETLEQQWLDSEHDQATLERILSEDFVHPVPAGVFLTKAEHIAWAVAHPDPPGIHRHFDQLRVRLYGDLGIVNGIVVSVQADGVAARSIFTDVFARRDGRWQAVSAQENAIR